MHVDVDRYAFMISFYCMDSIIINCCTVWSNIIILVCKCFNFSDDLVTLTVRTCLSELKIQGKTGNLPYAGSSSPHKIQLGLNDGTKLQGTLCHSTRNTPYLCTFSFATGLNAGSKCVQMEDINEVSLVANGNDGWYIASISTYVKTSSSQYMLLTKNDNFNK